ncbi:MAG: chemotaxis protein CheD [Nitrospirae bacterium]|nr:MAG: chemotaxis protein CheD [Nitrospirota bacterium]
MKYVPGKLPVIYLKPGEMYFSEMPTIVQTVLGSCVSVTLYSPLMSVGSICHGLLPKCRGRKDCDGTCVEGFRFVECSVQRMIEQFRMMGIYQHEIEAKVFGGADMLEANKADIKRLTVGAQNIQMAMKVLDLAGIKLAASDLGGEQGRKILFYTHTGEVLLKRLKKSLRLYDIGDME